MIIAVDMGHALSGADYGAVGIIPESNLTREVGQKLIDKLISRGHTVINCTVDSASSVNESLQRRVTKANAQPVDLFVCIHANKGIEEASGTEVFISARGGKAEEYANKVLDSICTLGYYKRGVRVAKEYLGYNLYVLSNTDAPAILIETLFVSNQEDVNKYNADSMAEKIAVAITGQTSSGNTQGTVTSPQVEIPVVETHTDLTLTPNAIAVIPNDFLYVRDTNRNILVGKAVDNGDKVQIIKTVGDLALVNYPTPRGVSQGYVTAKFLKPYYNGQVVNVSTSLNVRASEGGAVCGSLNPNEKVTIVYESGDWLYVTYDTNQGILSKSGFVNKNYIKRI
jgi:N-acetylmuramoyl-L-alanine amidase